MASTIQLKTGTSGAPSSLTNGEVAINVNDGLFYYGSGSGNDVRKLETFTNVTASVVSASSNLIVSEITASGNISSSGNIIANNFIVDTNTEGIDFKASNGTLFTNILTNANDDFIVQNLKNGENLRLRAGQSGDKGKVLIQQGGTSTNIAEFGPTNSIHLSGSITASGNISASGIIYGRQIEQHDMGAGSFAPSTTTTFFPFGGQTRDESTGAVNQNIQKISIVPGKPRKVVIRAVNAATGLGTQGFTCSYHSTNITANGTVTLVGAKYANSTGNAHEAVVFDFTSGVDEGSYDDVLPNRRIYMSLKVDDNSLSAISVLGATALWEWDYNA